MSRAYGSVAVLLIVLLGSACHHGLRPGVTSLASAPISPGPPSAEVVTSPAEPPGSTASRERPRPQLVSPGLDNTISGGIASTGAPLTCGVP
jgi:hypothetical protein